jgi:hypothetical protein
MKTIKGTFDVKLTPIEVFYSGDGINKLNRLTIDKQFSGALEAKSKGEMLSAMTQTEGSAGYVAIENVEGMLDGKKGSFVLQHYGQMCSDSFHLTLEVVPDSGTAELKGLSGVMKIINESGKHYYELTYKFK